MTTIKIVSNPYDQKTKFFSLESGNEEWNPIRDTNPNSKLLSSKLIDGFFPFVAADILEIIVDEYSGKEKINIVFEGTDDEFIDLKEICDESYENVINLTRSPIYLLNAEDVLPEIIRIFKQITPLVQKSVSDDSILQRKMSHFNDAANDTIPICVLGNYSSGKSSFINSLIGYEILPNGNEPVTARVYQIERNNRNDQAVLSFEIESEPVKLVLEDNKYKFESGRYENDLLKTLSDLLEKHVSDSIVLKLNRVLSAMTKYEKRHKDCMLSDLIKIFLPIVTGWMVESPHKFVIFDTPGSNSASNQEHSAVLRRAMEDLSNGIPIFVSEIDRLDTNDSEQLYEEIKKMDGFDTRFTLIVISKADNADLSDYDEDPEDEIETILSQSVPKNMYSEGIFFVSSVMGLGSKNDAEFIDNHSAEIFDEKQSKYSNPSSRFYRQLFKYDIMPSQLKARAEKAADKHKNKLYANSGLYTVENEIMTFADKYSAYNKCKQSQRFLEDVMEITSNAIENSKQETSENLDVLRRDLDEKTKELSERIESLCSTIVEEKLNGYEDETLAVVDECTQSSLKDENYLKDLSKHFTKFQESEKQYDVAVMDAKKASASIGEHLLKNIRTVLKERNVKSFQEGFQELKTDLAKSKEENERKDKLGEESQLAAADDVVNTINEEFLRNRFTSQDRILQVSTQYWEKCTAEVKQKLSTLVTDSSALSLTEKSAIGEVIELYQDISFDKENDVKFIREKFEYSPIARILMAPDEKINLEKLKNNYNREITNSIHSFYKDLEEEHKKKFEDWTTALKISVLANIVELNPKLAGKYKNIENAVNKLQELEERNLKLSQFAKEIVDKIDWIEPASE